MAAEPLTRRSLAAEPGTGEEDRFLTADLSPRVAGMPLVVWVSQRGNGRHDARVKVSLEHGHFMRAERTCSVSIRPTVEIVAGSGPTADDLALVRGRIERNRAALLDYREERSATDELLERLVKI